MGYAGKIESQRKARELRSRGLSMGEIKNRLKVSKSSVSLWVRDIKLTKKQVDKLYRNKKTGALKGSYIAAQNKIQRTEQLIDKLMKEGRKEIGKISKRDRFIAGVAMYFAEGGKTGGSVQFSNSDPLSVLFMVNWFREFCEMSDEKLRCSMYLHDDLNEKKAKKYWSDLIDIPLLQFRKTYIVKNNKNRYRKTRNENGVFRIEFSDKNMLRKIKGWISGLLQNYPS